MTDGQWPSPGPLQISSGESRRAGGSQRVGGFSDRSEEIPLLPAGKGVPKTGSSSSENQ